MVGLNAVFAASLASSAAAAKFSFWNKRADTCHGYFLTFNQQSVCCPGIIQFKDGKTSNDINDAYCCVGGSFAAIPTSVSLTSVPGATGSAIVGLPQFSSCAPSCGATVTGKTASLSVVAPATITPTCKTTIPLAASDYSSRADAAGSSAGFNAVTSGGENAGTTPVATASSQTGSSARTGGTTVLTGTVTQSSSTTASNTGASAAAQSTTASSSTGRNAGPQVTAAPVAGALALAGGLLVAAI